VIELTSDDEISVDDDKDDDEKGGKGRGDPKDVHSNKGDNLNSGDDDDDVMVTHETPPLFSKATLKPRFTFSSPTLNPHSTTNSHSTTNPHSTTTLHATNDAAATSTISSSPPITTVPTSTPTVPNQASSTCTSSFSWSSAASAASSSLHKRGGAASNDSKGNANHRPDLNRWRGGEGDDGKRGEGERVKREEVGIRREEDVGIKRRDKEISREEGQEEEEEGEGAREDPNDLIRAQMPKRKKARMDGGEVEDEESGVKREGSHSHVAGLSRKRNDEEGDGRNDRVVKERHNTTTANENNSKTQAFAFTTNLDGSASFAMGSGPSPLSSPPPIPTVNAKAPNPINRHIPRKDTTSSSFTPPSPPLVRSFHSPPQNPISSPQNPISRHPPIAKPRFIIQKGKTATTFHRPPVVHHVAETIDFSADEILVDVDDDDEDHDPAGDGGVADGRVESGSNGTHNMNKGDNDAEDKQKKQRELNAGSSHAKESDQASKEDPEKTVIGDRNICENVEHLEWVNRQEVIKRQREEAAAEREKRRKRRIDEEAASSNASSTAQQHPNHVTNEGRARESFQQPTMSANVTTTTTTTSSTTTTTTVSMTKTTTTNNNNSTTNNSKTLVASGGERKEQKELEVRLSAAVVEHRKQLAEAQAALAEKEMIRGEVWRLLQQVHGHTLARRNASGLVQFLKDLGVVEREVPEWSLRGGILRRYLRKAKITYHPDKVHGSASEKIAAEEISKILNGWETVCL